MMICRSSWDEAKALLAQCQDPQGLVKSLQESAERIRLLEKRECGLVSDFDKTMSRTLLCFLAELQMPQSKGRF